MTMPIRRFASNLPKQFAAFLICAVCVSGWSSCTEPSQGPGIASWQVTFGSGSPAEGLPQDHPTNQKRQIARSEAALTWNKAPSQATALQLAKAYYPEAQSHPGQLAPEALHPDTALTVKLPTEPGAPMEIATRGYVFRVTRAVDEGVLSGAPNQRGKSGTHLWLPLGANEERDGHLLTHHLEEYDIIRAGSEFSAHYQIDIPAGITGVRDAGDVLEFIAGNGSVPVLRMHRPQVRDQSGAARGGTVSLRGKGDIWTGPTQTLPAVIDAEVHLDLSGLRGTLVVDPGWSSTANSSTSRYRHTAVLLPSGKVMVAGGRSYTPFSNVTGRTELYDKTTETWSLVGALNTARASHAAVLLPSGKALITGGDSDTNLYLADTEIYDPVSQTWTVTASLANARRSHTATLLDSGKVLVVGGIGTGGLLDSAEIYDPESGTWSSTGNLAQRRDQHTATLLPSGKVLVVGGRAVNDFITPHRATAELYDPATGSWSPAEPLTTARSTHSATLLLSGQVLVTGGIDRITVLSSAELYDPSTGHWTATQSMPRGLLYHTATLLPSGEVVITGGSSDNANCLPYILKYVPSSGAWLQPGSLIWPRKMHTATVFQDGAILVMGGLTSNAGLDVDPSSINTAEIYDPAYGRWPQSTPNNLLSRREHHSVTLLSSGSVLVAGGFQGTTPVNTVEIFNLKDGRWRSVAPLGVARGRHSANLLPSGRVLVVGGEGTAGPLLDVEMYDPELDIWTVESALDAPRVSHTATLLGSNRVLVTGGSNNSGPLSTVEIYDAAMGSWMSAQPLAQGRERHTATLLASGRVLVAGGSRNGQVVPGTEVFDETTLTWQAAGALMEGRGSHTATLLPSGRVLLAGGQTTTGSLSSSEIYDPLVGTWSAVHSLRDARSGHSASLLPNGQVMVAGGVGSTGVVASAEVYTEGGGWFSASSMKAPRSGHAAVVLMSGRTLLVGGSNQQGTLNSAEMYVPELAAGLFGCALATQRFDHTATLLPSGKVLLAGGQTNVSYPATMTAAVELYDPSAAACLPTGNMTSPRSTHTSTLLPSGKVLVVGGVSVSTVLATAELYDPDSGTWSATGSLSFARSTHTATLLASGKVLVAGGWGGSARLSSVELYDPETGVWSVAASLRDARQAHTATLLPSGHVVLLGGKGLSGGTVKSAETYDPVTGSWSVRDGLLYSGSAGLKTTLLPSGLLLSTGGGTGELSPTSGVSTYDPTTGAIVQLPYMVSNSRYAHASTLLPSGLVLVTGGGPTINKRSPWIFDPSTLAWVELRPTHPEVAYHTATLLPSGNVVLCGGKYRTSRAIGACNVVDTLGASEPWRPRLDGITGDLEQGRTYRLLGAGLRGVSEGNGGGAGGSATDQPHLTLQSLNGDLFFPLDRMTGFDAQSVTVEIPLGVPDGNYILWVSTNGIFDGQAVHVHTNQAPLVRDMILVAAEDTPKNFILAGRDPEHAALVYTISSGPQHGTLSGTPPDLVYQPSPDYHGPDNFTYHATDGALTSPTATVSIVVDPANDPPVAHALNVTLDEDSAAEIEVTGTDVDDDALTFIVGEPPAHGSLEGSGPLFRYVPAQDFHGVDSFTYVVDDGFMRSTYAQVQVLVNPVNDPPRPNNLGMTVYEDTPVRIALSGSDVDGDGLEAAILDGPAHGTLIGTAPFMDYVPSPDYNGPDRFTFTVTDPSQASGIGTVTIEVIPLNDAPVFVAPTPQGTVIVLAGQDFRFQAHAVDVDGPSLLYSAQGLPPGATFDSSSGEFAWTPGLVDQGNHVVVLEVSDGALSDSRGLSLLVSAPDTDRDGILDATENAFHTLPDDPDSDHDGMPDGVEFGSGPLPRNSDTDDLIDALDPDSDNDTILDSEERGPFGGSPRNTDGLDEPDYLDTDSDEDGVPDRVEAGDEDPLTAPVDGDSDGKADYLDDDSDDDHVPDSLDNCRVRANEAQLDQDQDGLGDACDTDVIVVGSSSSENGESFASSGVSGSSSAAEASSGMAPASHHGSSSRGLSSSTSQGDSFGTGSGGTSEEETRGAQVPREGSGCGCEETTSAPAPSAGLVWLLAALFLRRRPA